MSSRTLLLLVAPSLAMAGINIPAHNVFVADLSPCTTVQAIASSCSSAIPTITDAPASQIAACFCCSGGSWSPNYFDAPVSSCVAELKSEYPAETSLLSVFSAVEGLCSSFGSVPCSGAVTGTGTGTGTGTITSAPTAPGSASAGAITGSAACDSAVGIIESCSLSMTKPTFEDATEDELAACMCYDGSTWVPDVFDGYASGCASWAKTGNPTLYKTYTSIATFCEYVGDVAAATASTSRKTSATTTRTGGGLGLPSSFSSTRTVIVTPTATPANSNSGSLVTKSRLGGVLIGLLGLYLML